MQRKIRNLNIILLALLSFEGGCALARLISEAGLSPKHSSWDSSLSPYKDEFLKETNAKDLPAMTSGFAELPGDIIGECSNFANGKREIELDKNQWSWSSEIAKKALMFHELGHCLCNLGHTYVGGTYDEKKPHGDGYLSDNCPKSLMVPVIPNDRCLVEHWEVYKEDIKKQCENK